MMDAYLQRNTAMVAHYVESLVFETVVTEYDRLARFLYGGEKYRLIDPYYGLPILTQLLRFSHQLYAPATDLVLTTFAPTAKIGNRDNKSYSVVVLLDGLPLDVKVARGYEVPNCVSRKSPRKQQDPREFIAGPCVSFVSKTHKCYWDRDGVHIYVLTPKDDPCYNPFEPYEYHDDIRRDRHTIFYCDSDCDSNFDSVDLKSVRDNCNSACSKLICYDCDSVYSESSTIEKQVGVVGTVGHTGVDVTVGEDDVVSLCGVDCVHDKTTTDQIDIFGKIDVGRVIAKIAIWAIPKCQVSAVIPYDRTKISTYSHPDGKHILVKGEDGETNEEYIHVYDVGVNPRLGGGEIVQIVEHDTESSGVSSYWYKAVELQKCCYEISIPPDYEIKINNCGYWNSYGPYQNPCKYALHAAAHPYRNYATIEPQQRVDKQGQLLSLNELIEFCEPDLHPPDNEICRVIKTHKTGCCQVGDYRVEVCGAPDSRTSTLSIINPVAGTKYFALENIGAYYVNTVTKFHTKVQFLEALGNKNAPLIGALPPDVISDLVGSSTGPTGLPLQPSAPYDAELERNHLIDMAQVFYYGLQQFEFSNMVFSIDLGENHLLEKLDVKVSFGYQTVTSMITTSKMDRYVKCDHIDEDAPASIEQTELSATATTTTISKVDVTTSSSSASGSNRYLVTAGDKKVLDLVIDGDGQYKIAMGIPGETITPESFLIGWKGGFLEEPVELAEPGDHCADSSSDDNVKIPAPKIKPRARKPCLIKIALEKKPYPQRGGSRIAQNKMEQFNDGEHYSKFSSDEVRVLEVWPLEGLERCATPGCKNIALWGENENTQTPRHVSITNTPVKEEKVEGKEEKKVVGEEKRTSSSSSSSSLPYEHSPLDGNESKGQAQSANVGSFCVGCSKKLKNARLIVFEKYVVGKGLVPGTAVAVSPIAKKPLRYERGQIARAEGKFDVKITDCSQPDIFPGIYFFLTLDRLFDYVFGNLPLLEQNTFERSGFDLITIPPVLEWVLPAVGDSLFSSMVLKPTTASSLSSQPTPTPSFSSSPLTSAISTPVLSESVEGENDPAGDSPVVSQPTRRTNVRARVAPPLLPPPSEPVAKPKSKSILSDILNLF